MGKQSSSGQSGRPNESVGRDVLSSFLPYSSREEGEPAAGHVVEAISGSAVPPSLLINIAGKIDFPGLPLIRQAAGLSASKMEGGQGDIFSRPTVHPVGDENVRAPFTGDEAVRFMRSGEVEDVVEVLFGRISRELGEEREGQQEMAFLVLEAIRNNRISVIEGGTGTGKTLAYLVPALVMAVREQLRVVVSTHTRNLQDQLFRGEMPLLMKLSGVPVKVERLTGRENYLCSRKIVSAAVSKAEDNPRMALAIAITAALSPEGTVASLPPGDYYNYISTLTAPPRCPMGRCNHASCCPLVRARKRARKSRILFVNHALLLTDYRQDNGILGSYDAVIFDEAHHLEQSVAENLSVTISGDDLDRITEELYPLSVENERWKFLLNELGCGEEPELADAVRKGLWRWLPRLRGSYTRFFAGLRDELNPDGKFNNSRTRYYDGREAFASVNGSIKNIWLYYSKLKSSLDRLLEVNMKGEAGEFLLEIRLAGGQMEEFMEGMRFLLEGDDEDSVFWMEWGESGSARRICGSPLMVGRLFAGYLEDMGGPALLTSATLSQNESFEYTVKRLGLDQSGREVDTRIIESPFDYPECCRMLLYHNGEDPNRKGFGESVGEVVEKIINRVGRRTMVLFTSYRMCYETAGYLRDAGLKVPVLVQGWGDSRHVLADKLRNSHSGVLLGVASFWEGVDFPGEELEILIIPKIPFPVPAEPMVEARSEKMRANGENPFQQLFMPEAVLRLRQGVGRLIRSREDRGVVVFMDHRLQSRPYGARIVSSLPSPVENCGGMDELIKRMVNWFS